MIYDVAVIGGGAAGMVAAISAKNNNSVLVIEKNDKLGRKILSTGNGKCNLTNTNMRKECFHSKYNSDFYNVINDFGAEEIREMFRKYGMLTIEQDGYVYPASKQAATVLDILRYKVDEKNINTLLSTAVKSISKHNNIFEIQAGDTIVKSRRVILTTGGKAASKLGSDGSGYDIAKSLSHNIVEPVPALVQLRCKNPYLKALSGVRANAKASVLVDNNVVSSDIGEVQFTDYGLSGIVIFQQSGFVKRLLDSNKKPMISLNFAYDWELVDLVNFVKESARNNPSYDLCTLFSGLFNKKIATILAKEDNIEAACRLAQNFKYIPTDTNGFDNAQVCAGGIDCREINFKTMESRKVKDLFFAGEIIDVDGICGGYNLTWAFASGRLAGISAGDIHQ